MGSLEDVTKLAKKQFKLEKEIIVLNEKLKKKGEEHKQVSEVDLPDLMIELELEEFKLRGGWKITIKESTFASISKDNRPKAFGWLKKKGFDDIIKWEGKIIFDRGNRNQIDSFLKVLKQRKILKDLPSSVSGSIHGQILKAFIKEQREKGIEFPDSFNIFIQKKSVIGK